MFPGPRCPVMVLETHGEPFLSGPATGALAGLVATAAMTAAMTTLFRILPREDRYPLPPAEITAVVAGRAGLFRGSSVAETLLAHFAFGALAGGLFGWSGRLRGVTAAQGVAYGLAVWTASYFGWIPALGILKPADRHPSARTGLMLLAHVVWGSALAVVGRRLARRR